MIISPIRDALKSMTLTAESLRVQDDWPGLVAHLIESANWYLKNHCEAVYQLERVEYARALNDRSYSLTSATRTTLVIANVPTHYINARPSIPMLGDMPISFDKVAQIVTCIPEMIDRMFSSIVAENLPMVPQVPWHQSHPLWMTVEQSMPERGHLAGQIAFKAIENAGHPVACKDMPVQQVRNGEYEFLMQLQIQLVVTLPEKE